MLPAYIGVTSHPNTHTMAKLSKEEIQIEVNLKMEQAKETLNATITKMNSLKKTVDELEASGKRGSDEWTKAFGELQEATVSATKAQDTFNQAGKAFVRTFKTITTEADLAGNSIRGLERQAKQIDLKLKASVTGSEEYNQLLGDLTDVQLKLEKQKREQRELAAARRDAASVAAAAGRIEKASLIELQEASAALNRQIAHLTPNTEEWIAASRKLSMVDARIESIGNTTKKTGNSLQDMKGVLTSALGFTLADTVSNAVQGINQAVHDGVDAIVAYENALTDLQAITGVSDAELETLKQSAEELTTIVTDGGNKISNTSTDIFEAFKLVGSAKPELLKNAEGLKAVTQEALILAKAGGQALPEAVKSMTSIMNQFNLPASEARRIINAISAGAKEGSVEITQEAEAIDKFGASAKLANVSLEQSVALAQIVGKVIPEASSAGLQLKTVITNIDQPKLFSKDAVAAVKEYGVNLALLEDRTVPFSEKLRELSKIQNDGAAIVRVFGRESQVAATQLLQNVDAFEQMTTAVTGTNEAYKQAATRSNNLGTDMANLSADVKQLFLEIAAGNSGALNDLVRGLDDAIVSIREWIDPLSAARAEHEQLVDSVQNLTENINPLLTEYDTLTATIAENTKAGKDTRTEQERVKSIIEQVTATIPGVVTEFDKYGIAMDINTVKAREFIKVQLQMSAEAKQNRVELNKQRLEEIEARRKELEKLQTSGTREARGLLEQAVAPLAEGGLGKLLGTDKRKTDLAASNAQLQELIALQNEEKAIKGELIALTHKETEAEMKKRVHDEIFTPEYMANRQAMLDAANRNTAATTADADATEKATTKKKKAHKKEKQAVELVAGSIAFLRDEVQKLNKELENEPPEKQAELAKKLAAANILLAEAEAKLAKAKKEASGRVDTPEAIKSKEAPKALDTEIAIVDYDAQIANLSVDAQIDAEKRKNITKEELRREDSEKRTKNEQAWIQAAIQMTQQAANTIFGIWNTSSDRRKTRELHNVDLQYKGRLQAAKGNQRATDQIEKEMDEAKEEIERAAFKRKKRLDFAQAILNGALAITGIIASTAIDPTGILRTIQLAIAGVALASQLATIATTKYRKGGIVDGPSHEQGGIKMVAGGQVVGEMEGGESYMVLSRETTANNRPLIDALLDSSLNKNGGKVLATGGIVYTPTNTPVLDISRNIVQRIGTGNTLIDTTRLEQQVALLIQVVRNQQTQLAAVISYTDLEQAQRDVSKIRKLAK